MTYYDEQLQELQQQIARKNRLETILKDLHSQKEELEKKVYQLSIEKRKEEADVEQLEGRSLAAFYYQIVGKKAEKLDKERQEAYAAVVKYDVAVQELAALQEDIKRYNLELGRIRNSKERYEQVLKEKADAIKLSGKVEGMEIMQLEEQIAKLESQKKELKEAIMAGNSAKSTVNDVLSKLDSAEGWGTWDLFGGGLIADVAKHSSLDEAQNAIERLQIQLRRFKTELADVTVQADMQVNIDGFLRFADYFFDGLFADWTVLDQISRSQEQVKNKKRQIEDVLSKLNIMMNNVEKEQNTTKTKLNNLIVET